MITSHDPRNRGLTAKVPWGDTGTVESDDLRCRLRGEGCDVDTRRKSCLQVQGEERQLRAMD